jgi:hypothetical protein
MKRSDQKNAILQTEEEEEEEEEELCNLRVKQAQSRCNSNLAGKI